MTRLIASIVCALIVTIMPACASTPTPEPVVAQVVEPVIVPCEQHDPPDCHVEAEPEPIE